jgi:hypothetical protein
MFPSTGSSFGAYQQWGTSNSFGWLGSNYYAADFTGDGVCDLGFFEPNNNSFHVRPVNETGTGFVGGSTPWLAPGSPINAGGKFMVTYRKKRLAQ